MNKLLPLKSMLVPVTNSNSTFYECGFNTDFDKLSFIKKLEVVNDIIKQTILVDSIPHPTKDVETLIGDCHTAAKSSIEYLKYLGIGKNHKYVMCIQRDYDPENITSRHAAVLLEDDNGKQYLFDATPFVGYKFGTVTPLEHEKVYERYYEIKGERELLLNDLRKILYMHKTNQIKNENILKYIEIIDNASKDIALKGYASNCYEMLLAHTNDKLTIERLEKSSAEVNPYSRTNIDYELKKEIRNNLRKQKIEQWKQELKDIPRTKENTKKILEISQNIHQESKMFDENCEYWINLYGEKIRASTINPRFLLEKNLSLVMIKPSAYRLGVSATIREGYLSEYKSFVYEASCNVAKNTITGLAPMIYSHTLGNQNIRSMDGKSNMMLLEGFPQDLSKIKKELRAVLGKNIVNKDVLWFDGEKILWHPFVTNLVHTTDNSSETSLHLMFNHPEHQQMTRFMYPNPALEKELTIRYLKDKEKRNEEDRIRI